MIFRVVTIYFLIFNISMLAIERLAWIDGSIASFFQIIGFLLFFLYTKLIYNKNPKFILASFYQIFYFAGMLLSGLFLSFGVPMIEIGESGNSNGTFWVLMIFFVVGLYFSKKSFEMGISSRFGFNAPKFSIGTEKLICIGLATIPLILAGMVFFQYGAPATSEERTVFWNSVVPSYFSWVNSSLRQMFFFVALILVLPLFKYKIIPALYLMAYVFFTIFLLGEKASAFIILISIFLVVYAAGYTGKISRQVFLWGGVILLLIYYLIINSYRESDYGDAFVFTRIALQAQVLWSILNVESFPLMPSDSLSNIPDILNSADYLTYKFVPRYLYEIYTDTGNTLSGFLPAFPMIFLGFIGSLVMHAIVSVVMGYIAGSIVSAVASRAYIFSFLLLKIYLAIIFSWFALIFSAIFGIFSVISVLLIFAMYAVRRVDVRRGGVV